MTALDDLFAEFYDDVFRYIYSLCRDVSLAEDLTADVFLEIVKSIGSFNGKSSVKTWIFSIARHVWFKYLRKKKRSADIIGISELADCEPPDFNSAEGSFLSRELISRIYEIINSEPENRKNVALMRIQGYSFYEIGEKTGMSENSARVTFFRIKEKIRKILKEEGLYNE